MSPHAPSRSPIQDHLAACLTRALTAPEHHSEYDPTSQASFRQLEALFSAGEPFDPSIPLFGEHARHECLLASLDSELEDIMQTGKASEIVRMEKTIRAFLVLAAQHGWDPVLDPHRHLVISPEVRAREAIAQGHRQALEQIAAAGASRITSNPSRRF